MNRRQFIRSGVLVGGGILSSQRRAYALCQSPTLQLGKTRLRGAGPGGIPVAAPNHFPAPVTGVTHYTINIQEFEDRLHPHLGPDRLRGFHPELPPGGGVQHARRLGGIIVAQKGVPVQITFRNNLSPGHILPVDTTIEGAGGAQNRTAVHLHFGLAPWNTDGGPFDSWALDGTHGVRFLSK